ncbi:MAG: DUF2281 domain-containing protein [Rhizobacter sp.]|nr:DUF2281 domain-containing protein [Chlorobiales bacterium]
MSQELINVLSKLTPELQTEVLHYAEFLSEKVQTSAAQGEPKKKYRQAGTLKGMFDRLPDDFDEPLDDLKEYMQ